MSNLAIIPARGGSKRIPGKNIKAFLGKPIITYSISAALDSKLFDEVMVSTDDKTIADIAMKAGAKIPFFRSGANADDYATLSDVIEEVITSYRLIGKEFENICCILPTAPFVTAGNIVKGYEELVNKEFDTVFPIISFSYPIQRCLSFEKEKVEMVWEEHLNARSQDLPERFHDSGQYYWIREKAFKEQKKLFTQNSGAIIISELEAQDIDTETDWKLAELKYQLILDDE